MVTTQLLEKRVSGLQLTFQGLQRGKDLAQLAPLYRSMKGHLNNLFDYCHRLRRTAVAIQAINATLPTEWETARREIRTLLAGQWGQFEETYFAPAEMRVFDAKVQGIRQTLKQADLALDRVVSETQASVESRLSHMMVCLQVRKACGLTVQETAVKVLDAELRRTLEGVKQGKVIERGRWAALVLQLEELTAAHSIQSIPNVSHQAVDFLVKLLSGKGGALTLADLTPDVLQELQRFPALLAAVRLTR